MKIWMLAPTFSAKTVDKVVTKTSESATSKDNFTWDNASVYFLLTDRFNNGNTSNDHSYGRELEKDATVNSKGKVVVKKKGRATVTVTTRDGRKTAGCTIIVNKFLSN